MFFWFTNGTQRYRFCISFQRVTKETSQHFWSSPREDNRNALAPCTPSLIIYESYKVCWEKSGRLLSRREVLIFSLTNQTYRPLGRAQIQLPSASRYYVSEWPSCHRLDARSHVLPSCSISSQLRNYCILEVRTKVWSVLYLAAQIFSLLTKNPRIHQKGEIDSWYFWILPWRSPEQDAGRDWWSQKI